MRQRLAVSLCLVLLTAALVPVAVAGDRTAELRRLLELLAGARLGYLEAFEDRGAEMESLTELEEVRLRFADARLLNDQLRVLPAEDFAAIATDLESLVGRADVPDRLAALAAAVTQKTGVELQTVPPAAPSAARGRALYRENCAGCHGVHGAGDGTDTRGGQIIPADFTNVVFMRRENPLDFFLMIGIGHRRRGMPEWSRSLSNQQRWDLVAWVWGLQQSDADRAAGARVWTDRCAGCHGATGTGVKGKAADLTRPGSLVDVNDRVLFVRLFRAPHAEAFAGLTDAQRWQAVGHVRALSLGGSITEDSKRRR